MMSYISLHLPTVLCKIDICGLFPHGFGGRSVCREAVRGFAAIDTLSQWCVEQLRWLSWRRI